jgi:O-antigen/teichoic acid export membrane protein
VKKNYHIPHSAVLGGRDAFFPQKKMDTDRCEALPEEQPVAANNDLKKQLFPNLISNGIVLGLNILISLWFTPYLIRHLGVAVYGLLPLAFALTAYLNIITLSLNNAAGRYLAIDLQNKDTLSANRTFNTIFFGNIGAIVLCLPIIAAVLFFSPRLFNIPRGQEFFANYLFLAVFATYLLNFFRSSFSVSTWALNRFDLRNIVVALYYILRAGFVVLLFLIFRPSLLHLGTGFLLAACVWLAGDILLWRKLTPQLRIRPALFDRGHLGQLFTMGGWLLINQLGVVLFLKIDLVIANTFLGAKIAGEYGSVLLFSSLIQQLAYNMSMTLTPSLVSKYACGDVDALQRISRLAVKCMGLILALPVGLICGFSRPLLLLWLGKNFLHLQPLLIVLTVHLALNMAVRPLFGLNIAYNKVRVPGLASLALGVFNLLLAIALVQGGWGVLGIAMSGALSMTLRNLFFTPLYAAHVQKLPLFTYLRTLLPLALVNAFLIGAIFCLSRLSAIKTWAALAALAAAVSLVYGLITYCFVLRREEKSLLWKLLPLWMRPGLAEND